MTGQNSRNTIAERREWELLRSSPGRATASSIVERAWCVKLSNQRVGCAGEAVSSADMATPECQKGLGQVIPAADSSYPGTIKAFHFHMWEHCGRSSF